MLSVFLLASSVGKTGSCLRHQIYRTGKIMAVTKRMILDLPLHPFCAGESDLMSHSGHGGRAEALMAVLHGEHWGRAVPRSCVGTRFWL